jgi:hypothetical protein
MAKNMVTDIGIRLKGMTIMVNGKMTKFATLTVFIPKLLSSLVAKESSRQAKANMKGNLIMD